MSKRNNRVAVALEDDLDSGDVQRGRWDAQVFEATEVGEAGRKNQSRVSMECIVMSEECELDLEHPMLLQLIELLADILVAPANPKRDTGHSATATLPVPLASDGQATRQGRNGDRGNLAPEAVQ